MEGEKIVEPSSHPDEELDLLKDDDGSLETRSMDAHREARSQIESHSMITTTMADGDVIRATALESKSVDRYIDVVMQAIKKLEIKGDEVTELENPLMDTTTKAGSRGKAMLPLNNQQRERIDRVWYREKWSTPTLSAVTKGRFKIAEADYEKYFKVGSLSCEKDNLLLHSLEHTGYKLGKVPKHCLKAFTDIEAKTKVIEGRSVLGMAGAVSVSWLIHYSLV